jgi:hypothetical protein
VPPRGSKKLDAKKAARLRRHELEEQKRRLARRERLRTWGLAGLAVLAGAGIVAAVAVPRALKPKPVTERSFSSFGSSPSKAGCGSPLTRAPGKDVVIGPGSKQPKRTKGSYASVPPVGGEHYANPVPTTPNFYVPANHPRVEQLVANELQGDTVAWYLPSIGASQQKTLRQLAQRMAVDNPNFVVAPWDSSYGKFPAGKAVAFATIGHVEYCAKVSGAAAADFVQQFPAVAPSESPTVAPTTISPTPTPTGTGKGTPAPKGTHTKRSSPSPSTS